MKIIKKNKQNSRKRMKKMISVTWKKRLKLLKKKPRKRRSRLRQKARRKFQSSSSNRMARIQSGRICFWYYSWAALLHITWPPWSLPAMRLRIQNSSTHTWHKINAKWSQSWRTNQVILSNSEPSSTQLTARKCIWSSHRSRTFCINLIWLKEKWESLPSNLFQ